MTGRKRDKGAGTATAPAPSGRRWSDEDDAVEEHGQHAAGVILPNNEETEAMTDLMIEYLRREIDGKLMPGIVEMPPAGRATTAGGD